jgi:hypothetical protein
MCTCARPYGRARRCGFGGRGVTKVRDRPRGNDFGGRGVTKVKDCPI